MAVSPNQSIFYKVDRSGSSRTVNSLLWSVCRPKRPDTPETGVPRTAAFSTLASPPFVREWRTAFYAAASFFHNSIRTAGFCQRALLPERPFLLPQRAGIVRQAQEIIHTGVIKPRQGDQRPAGNVQPAALIAGIGRLGDMKQLRQDPLRQVPVLPEVPQTVVHPPLPFPQNPSHSRICENCILIFIRKSHKIEKPGDCPQNRELG